MMKKFYLLAVAAFTFFNFQTQAQNFNFVLQGSLAYPGDDLANIWGWADGAGNEYGLVGTEAGLSIVDVTNPQTPTELFLIPGPRSIWREVKTHNHYAYVTTEGGGGLTVIDLSGLPNTAPYHLYTGDGAIAGQLDNIHSLHIDGGYLYLHGSNLFNGTTVICDLNVDPWNPTYVSNLGTDYVHDGFARGNFYYPCHVYAGTFDIVDVTNKANPITLNSQSTPGQFTHNSWLSTNNNFLFTTDEIANSFLTSYDVSNPNNIIELDKMQVTPGSQSIIHNTHIIQKSGTDYAVSSWYKDGVAIADVERPDNMVFIGWFDTYVQGAGGGFNGAWGAYMYLPSGNVLVSDIDNGLYVLTPTYARACYLEGTVTDSITTFPINNALVEILTTGINKNSKITGQYKTGYYQSGTYDIRVSKSGYITKTIYGVSLTNGIVTNLDVQLVPSQIITFTGQVIEAGTGNAVPNAKVSFSSFTTDYNVTANAVGSFTISNFFTDNYDYVGGKWGYINSCGTAAITASGIIITLDKGYYDDFALDFGWTNSGAPNDWERGEPVGTTANSGAIANPEVDIANDCLDQAFVTGNGGGSSTDNDVDPNDGLVTLTSPLFDLTSYINPQIKYARWFFNGLLNGNPPNDAMMVKLSNGITTITLETIAANDSGNGTWFSKTWNVSGLIAPTANMQLLVQTSDISPSSVVEGGFDKFEVTDGTTTINEAKNEIGLLSAFPNPFTKTVTISYSLNNIVTEGVLELTDITGKIILEKNIISATGTLQIDEKINNGIYFVTIKSAVGISKTLKIVKAE